MNLKVQAACAWCGIGFVVFATLGWWIIAGMLPPISPSFDAAAIADFYQTNTGVLRTGILIGMISVALTIPWIAVLAVHLKRAEGAMPVFTIMQIVAGTVTVVILTLPFVIWTTAAFRPERAPELIQLANDFGWLMITMTFAPFFIQLASIGLAILFDRNPKPIFPRWVAYFNIWTAVLFIPGALVTYFKTGPFAWNGILAFWLPLIVFMGWYIVMCFVLLKVIKEQPQTS